MQRSDLLCDIDQQAAERGTLDFYENITRPMLPIIVEIMNNGFNVDYGTIQDVRRHYEQQKRGLERSIKKKLKVKDPDFNVGSDDQMVTQIEKVTRIKWPREKWFLTDSGSRGRANKEVRQAMSALFPHGIWRLWADYKKVVKLLSNYLDVDANKHATHGTSKRPRSITAKLCPTTGKAHTSLKPHGTDTFRRSSTDPNLQNISKRNEESSIIDASLIRSAFLPSQDNRVLTICDYDTAEVWVAAHLSQDPELLRIFAEGLDMHSMTAAGIFGYKSYEEFIGLVNEAKKLQEQHKPLPAALELAMAQRTKAKGCQFRWNHVRRRR